MATKKANVEVKKNSNENNMSLLRRFSRRIQESNMTRIVKAKRYSSRKTTKLGQKNMALKKITRRKEVARLQKLGKMA